MPDEKTIQRHTDIFMHSHSHTDEEEKKSERKTLKGPAREGRLGELWMMLPYFPSSWSSYYRA